MKNNQLNIILGTFALLLFSSWSCLGQDLIGDQQYFDADHLVVNGNYQVSGYVDAAIKLNNKYRSWTMYNSSTENNYPLIWAFSDSQGYGGPQRKIGTKVMQLDSYGNLTLWSSIIARNGNFLINNIYASGNVGIGTDSPQEKLHIPNGNVRVDNGEYQSWGAIKLHPDVDKSGDDDVLFLDSNGNTNMIVDRNGNVGIGTSTPAHKLDVNGEINARGFKLNGVPFTGGGASQWVTSGTNISYSTGNIGLKNTNPSVALEIGTDNATTQTEYLRVHGSASFNNDTNETAITQVSINTNVKVGGTSLTVGGPTFIGSWQDAENGATVDAVATFNDYNLWVTKGIMSEAFALMPNDSWKDEVFKTGYNLPSLTEVQTYIEENKHLPGIISEKEVKTKGYDLHEMNKAFLEKIENLYLYSINQEKEIKILKQELNQLNELKAAQKILQEKLEKLELQK